MNITQPEVATPAAAYLPYVQTGKLLFFERPPGKKRRQGDRRPARQEPDRKAAARAVAID